MLEGGLSGGRKHLKLFSGAQFVRVIGPGYDPGTHAAFPPTISPVVYYIKEENNFRKKLYLFYLWTVYLWIIYLN